MTLGTKGYQRISLRTNVMVLRQFENKRRYNQGILKFIKSKAIVGNPANNSPSDNAGHLHKNIIH